MKNVNRTHADQIEAMLQQLPQAAEQGLGGLTAGPHLKARIQLAASEPHKARPRISMNLVRWASVACCALMLAFVGVRVLQQPGAASPDGSQPALIDSASLGPATDAPDVLTADLNNSSVFIAPANRNPGYRSIWASSSNSSFPLIGVNGKYYRLLTSPRSVSNSLIGEALGTVAEFTTEPSLSGTDTVLSNTVAFGETVYAIRGMGNTLVTAKVEGRMRLFQRVSFNGYARMGRESLADTLQVRGNIIAMELTSVGTITDPAVCETLLSTLFSCASFESSGSISSSQSLLLEMSNGLVLQMAVKNDNLAACGVWSCPEFFEAFEEACE